MGFQAQTAGGMNNTAIMTSDQNCTSLSALTFNMHGFNQGSVLLKEVCEKQIYDLIFIQEHWLYPSNISKLLEISPHYIGHGISAMESAVDAGFIKGRPYGGCAILVNNKYKNMHADVCTFERVVAILLGDVLLINVYCPCENGSTEGFDALNEILANIANILDTYKAQYVVIGGDFNTDLSKDTTHSVLIKEFLDEYGIKYCKSEMFGSVNIQFERTFACETTGAGSCIDFFCVSDNICNNVMRYKVLDMYSNHSDHRPILCQFCVPVQSSLHQYVSSGCVNFVNERANANVHASKQSAESEQALRWDLGNVQLYNDLTYQYLYPIYDRLMNYDNMHSVNETNINEGKEAACVFIEQSYNDLTNALHHCAANSIPRVQRNAIKHWWNSELTELKKCSITSHNNWLESGKPRSGAVFALKQQDKLRYKQAIKKVKNEADAAISDELHAKLCAKKTTSFWKTWKNKVSNKAKKQISVEGCNTDEMAVCSLAEHFRKATVPNCEIFNNEKKTEFVHKLSEYSVNSSPTAVTAEIVYISLSKVHKGKAPGIDNITAEHIGNSHVVIYSLLAKLFNMMLEYGHVPVSFTNGIIVPIPKDENNKNKYPVDNFRGITLSPVLSKIFEHCLLNTFGDYLLTCDNQFGFKTKVGCSHAVYAVRKITDYFVSGESTVNLCFLDISKGFDKVNKYELLLKLMNRRIPVCFIELLNYWLSMSISTVKWNGFFSQPYSLEAGVRQGGVLSPLLFAVYVNDMLCKLRKMGCSYKWLHFGAIMYADDLVLLAPSVYELQCMIRVCQEQLKLLDLRLNFKKSKALRIGKRYKHKAAQLQLNGEKIPWGTEAKYLGMVIQSAARFKCSFDQAKVKFYRGANAILSKLSNKSNVTLTLYLVSTIALPTLTYGIECLSLNKTEIKSLDYPWYKCFCRVFQTFDACIIQLCQAILGYKSIKEMYENRCQMFLEKIKIYGNFMLREASEL